MTRRTIYPLSLGHLGARESARELYDPLFLRAAVCWRHRSVAPHDARRVSNQHLWAGRPIFQTATGTCCSVDAKESSGPASPGQAKRAVDNDYADEAPRLVNAGRSPSRRLSPFGL